MKIRFLFQFTAICLATSGASATTQFMSGAVPIREPDNHYPILYSSVVPIIYKFYLPTWDTITMKIQFWSKHNNCTETDSYEDGYPCPILYHMNYLVEAFAQNMTSWKNLLFDRYSQKDSVDFLQDPSLLWKTGVCSNLRIEQHFKEMEANSSQLDKYIQVLSQCADKNGTAFNIKSVNMTDIATKLENQYHYTFMSFTSDYWKLLTEATQEATALIAWNTLESTLMVHQYMESQKWVEAVQTCNQKQIPWTIINKSSLKELLISLKNGYMENSYDFAIPVDEISKYFKLPLADCIFGDDNTFIVRIMVPLIPNEAASKNYFVKFHPLPFVTEGKVCSLWDGEKSIPFNVGFNGIMPCSCAKYDAFCKAWSTESKDTCSTSQRLQETCLHALASDLEDEIIQTCPMKCRSIDKRSQQDHNLDLVLESNATDIVKILPAILNEDPNRATFVECPGKKMPIPLQTVGAYQLSIPTNCGIVNGESYVPLNNTASNVERVKITHLMPYHWRNGITVDTVSKEADDSFLDTVQRLDAVAPKISLMASKIQQLDQDSNRALSDTLLWLLVLLSLMMNIALIVLVLHLYKWKKEQVYKANRLVYNISPDDDIQHFPISGDQQTRPLCDADSL